MKHFFRDPFSFILLGACGFLLITLFGNFFEESPAPHLQGIESDYQAAESAKTPPERQAAFNRSLESLLALERKYTPTMGNGLLYFAIADNFYQLQEYPKAILYYQRTLNLRPRDSQVEVNLQMAQTKLDLKEKHVRSPIQKLFFFHYYLSMPERFQLFSLLLGIAIITISAFLWLKQSWLRFIGYLALGLSTIIILSLLISYYFTPSEAIVISSSGLYRDAGKQYAKVIEDPLPSGLKVKVLSIEPSGKWIKIETNNGVTGFLPFESLQVI
jgi:tetratricopeptide (TPR) repeat protein